MRKGAAIVNNAKTRRVSVCNALDSVLIHASRLFDLPQLCAPLQESRVRIYADSRALAALQRHYPADLLEAATEKHFGTEFMDYKMAVKMCIRDRCTAMLYDPAAHPDEKLPVELPEDVVKMAREAAAKNLR